MKRVCIVGNSHVSALKLALRLDAQGDKSCAADVTIFGSPQNSLSRNIISNGRMSPGAPWIEKYFKMTSGGQSEITIDDYSDIYVVAGFSPYVITRYIPAGVFPPPGRALYQAVAANWRSSWAYILARNIKSQAKKASVHFLGEPFISIESAWAQKFLPSADAPDEAASRAVLGDVRAMIDECVAALPIKIDSILSPPRSCLDPLAVFTEQKYCGGSVKLTEKLDDPHADDDHRHMNGLYGAECLKAMGLMGGRPLS